jgi:SRSO17 transposase
VEQVRAKRLELTQQALQEHPFVLCLDETGDLKQGQSTDYVARQSSGKLGAVEQGSVSVNAYGVREHVTFPLLFQLFKPERRLKPGDH